MTSRDASSDGPGARAGWPLRLVAFASVLIALASWRYLVPGAPGGAPPILANAFTRYGVLTAHAAAASTALLLGPFQFLPGLRARRPRLHRWSGRAYVLACLLGGVSGAVLAFGARAGPPATAGFGLLAAAWLYTTWRAYDAARRRRFGAHRRWMIRSFALTFAAVTLRLYLPLAFVSPFGYEATYRVISFVCWIPNLLVAEVLLRRGPKTGLAGPPTGAARASRRGSGRGTTSPP
jgi:uncharacterized membrane protein